MWLFGKRDTKVSPKDAIISLRSNLELLNKKEEHLNRKIEDELRIAKANATKNKSASLAALKKKKMLTEQLEKIQGSIMTLETQIISIEGANINLQTMKAMKQGATAMKHIHKEMDVDKVDQTMDEIREQMDMANEVSAAIAQPEMLGVGAADSELLEELEQLEQEQLDKQLLGAGKAPTTRIKAPPKEEELDEEEAELAELRESMGVMN